MGFFKGYSGSSRTLRKPSKPLRVDRSIYSRFYAHNTESAAGFAWVGSRVNFLMEMMKFFPKFEQVGYAGESSEDFMAAMGEFGNAAGSPFWEGEGPLPTLWTEELGEAGVPRPDESYDHEGDYYVLNEHGNPYHKRANNPWGPADRGYTRDHFGGWHRDPRPSGDGLPWGFFEGKKAENLDFHPSISEFNHFEYPDDPRRKHYTIDKNAHDRIAGTNPDAPIDYANLFRFDPRSYADIWGNGKVFNKYDDDGNMISSAQVLSGGIKQALESYGDKSFYQIVMSGFKNGAWIDYGDLGDANEYDGERIRWGGDDDWDNNEDEMFFNGAFAYDNDNMTGPNGEGAFKLMLGLLESRRRIYSAMVDVFGHNEHIGRVVDGIADPDDVALINAFDGWMSDSARGLTADPHNLSLFPLFLQVQHSFHSIFPAYSFDPFDSAFAYKPDDSSGGIAGYIFSGKDQLAFQRFNKWMWNNVNGYKDYLEDLNEDDYVGLEGYRDKVDGLIEEYYGKENPAGNSPTVYDSQPYLRTKYEWTDYGKRAGWDLYCSDWPGDAMNDGENNGQGGPEHNITAPGPHPRHVLSQLNGLKSFGDRTGNVYDENGNLVMENMASRNWAIHHSLSFRRFGDRDIGRNIAINVQNRRSSRKYRKEMEEYHETKIDLMRQEARDMAKMKQNAAEHRANLKKLGMAAKRQSDNLKRMHAAAVRAKIHENLLAKKNKQGNGQGRKKKK